jgi:hypothetical protein
MTHCLKLQGLLTATTGTEIVKKLFNWSATIVLLVEYLPSQQNIYGLNPTAPWHLIIEKVYLKMTKIKVKVFFYRNQRVSFWPC